MARWAFACLLTGCGLVLDLDPAEPDGGPGFDASEEDAVKRDVDSPDATTVDAMPTDIGNDAPQPFDGGPDALPLDAGFPRDSIVVRPDANMGCSDDSECRALDGPCTQGVCVDRRCGVRPMTDGTMCDDDLFCTVGERCIGGVCGAQRTCLRADQCAREICDEGLRACSLVAFREGLECDVLNGEGTCENGACTVLSCLPPYEDCDPSTAGCETDLSTGDNCMTCGSTCDPNEMCTAMGCR